MLSKFPTKHLWVLGVSGGRDSVCLLHCLHRLEYPHVIVAHLDHALRPTSSQESLWVEQLTLRLGYQFASRRVDVKALSQERHLSLETCGRLTRREFWSKLCSQHQAQGVMLAHHAEDQAETLLMNLARGTGPTGLMGMLEDELQPQDSLRMIRPLLEFRRKDITGWLLQNQLEWLEDESNAREASLHQQAPLRNKIRHQLLPLFQEISGRDVVASLNRLSHLMRDEQTWLDEILQCHADLTVDQELRVQTIKSLPLAGQRRLVRAWLMTHQVSNLSLSLIESVRLLAHQNQPARVNLPQNLQARRKEGRIRLVSLSPFLSDHPDQPHQP